jgi:two-component system phosphate regulon sensor histidine kinase PhoR
VVFSDVTRLRRLESVRRDFVANVSHELKTPITAIKGSVETLLSGAMEEPQAAERFLHIVARQSERLEAIIDDLLALSRVEQDAEQDAVPLSLGEIRPVLVAAQQACLPSADEKKVEIRLFCSTRLRGRINAPLLEQAVVNLLINAIKYSPSGGKVVVDAAQLEDQLMIKVQDWGSGIAAEHLPRIFERFYRVDPARSRKLGGTGLGLAIVKHIIQAHGGQVVVHSTPGEGSVFTLLLPTVE